MPVDEKLIPASGTPIPPGGVRQLTIGEIALARTLFGSSLIYSKIWIHRESYPPFNMQPIDVAMTPNGELWLREETYSPDFSPGKYMTFQIYIKISNKPYRKYLREYL
ncbi:hypothetical protein TUM12370_11890 [Salmonella enterica subsp. enterica serovar Choleraesuis]|nr:hypothetical protein TUM12370_11890 [Salmonella enterica subsp. enterica serovar Choleraesuis]